MSGRDTSAARSGGMGPGRTAALIALLILLTATPAWGQAPTGPLTLSDAIGVAMDNNPTVLQTRNDEALSDWTVRQAYGELLPSASLSTGVSWQGAGEQRFGSLTLGDLGFGGQPSYYFSSYNLGLNYSLDWATLRGPARAKADRRTTRAQIGEVEWNLRGTVTNAYVDALRQVEGLRVAEGQLENAEFNLRLAQGQLEVGSVTPIDVWQAEVQVGRAEVTVLQARNAVETSQIRLVQQLGLPVGTDFDLVSTFDLTEPTWDLPFLVDTALDQNRGLRTGRSAHEAAELGVGAAKSSYWPTLSISTGWSGFTREASNTDFLVAQSQAQVARTIRQCVSTNELYSRLAEPLPPLDCNQFAFTDAQQAAVIAQNDQFPFNFEGSPPSVSVGLSIPIFQGLSRQRSVESARLQRDDLALQLREQELALRADLAIGMANVTTAYESALLEQRNRELADQQLRLTRERYQLGAATFLELVDAQTVLVQAEADRIQAVFAYHDSVTNLETLVGAPLRD